MLSFSYCFFNTPLFLSFAEILSAPITFSNCSHNSMLPVNLLGSLSVSFCWSNLMNAFYSMGAVFPLIDSNFLPAG